MRALFLHISLSYAEKINGIYLKSGIDRCTSHVDQEKHILIIIIPKNIEEPFTRVY